ncbi:extracellular solute-binding protein [Microbacterium sp. LMC-P-041]|uniref:ABC transporter substrate-binding protein n=1 Tax=Microbacterium sp. LMC-P-041 TaxID=3040293 RepID=UPI002552A662|nr:extracellular solute-binding protein [Microbacterium sp. LMC-P-041]
MHSNARKRALPAAAVIVTAALMTAGCAGGTGGGDAGADAPQELTIMWESGGKEALDLVIKEFKAVNPDVKVTVEYLDGQVIKTQVPTRLAAGTAPDLFRTEAGSGTTTATQILAARGYLAPIEIEGLELPESITATMTYENELYGFAPVLQSLGQVFNDEALTASGLSVPETWDDVLTFCADARALGTYAYAQGPVSLHENQTTPYALSGELVFEPDPDFDAQMADGKVRFPDSNWVKVLDRTLEMVDGECFPDGFEGNDMTAVLDSLATGKGLGMVGYSSYLPYASGSGATFSIYPLPASDDPEDSRLLVAPAQPFAINAKAKNVELAQEFLSFLAQPEMTQLYADTLAPTGGLLPASYLTQDPSQTQVNDMMLKYLDEERTFQFPDATWPNPEVQLALQSGMQEAIQGKRSVEDVLNAMQQAYDQGGPAD